MEIYIVRHGQTIWNASNLLQGNADIELNEKGRALAGETGMNLEDVSFDKIYSSPLIRAYETACLIRGHRNIPIIRDERLKELNFGVNEGKNFKALLEDTSTPFHHFFDAPELYEAPERGETFEQICERGKAFMKEVIEPQQEQLERVMIVAHGAMNKAMMCYIKNHGIEDYWSGGLQRNCGVIIVQLHADGYHVVDENKVFYQWE
ncbi:MAG: histidine phosphatase family protein [Lachnospiraceae bacterium]|nr:histidine phosphatase family protein [Lachnospiraceae bacterium]